MNKIYALLLILMTTVTGWSQTRSWNGGNGSWTDASKWTPIGVPLDTDSIEIKNVSGTIFNVPDLACKSIYIFSGNVILNGRDGQTKTMTAGDGNTHIALFIEAGASLTIGQHLDIALGTSGRALIDGTLIVTRDRHFVATAAGAKTEVLGLIRNEEGHISSTEGSLEFRDGSRYEHAGDKGSIPQATWSHQSTCAIEGILTQSPGGLDQVFGNYKWTCGLQTAGISLGVSVPSHIMGNLIIDKAGANASISLLLPSKTSVAGDLVLSEGIYMGKEATTVIEVGGNFTIYNSSLKANSALPNASITVSFMGRQKQSFAKVNSLFKGVRFHVDDKSILDLGEGVLDGDADFSLDAGATLITAHPAGIALTGASGAVQVTGKRNYSTEAHYIFTGNKQQVTGSGLPTVVAGLVIDNTAGVSTGGGVILSKATSVTKELGLRNGFLQTTTDKMLTLLDDAVATTVDHSFIAGPMQKKGKTSFTFPTGWSGTGGGQIPIGIDSMNTVATIQ
ncbi:MAG: hypothetical protein EOO94_01855, partial [Pedobacter sp.]